MMFKADYGFGGDPYVSSKYRLTSLVFTCLIPPITVEALSWLDFRKIEMSCILWVLGSSIEEIFDLLSDLLISKDLE
jgi:hypothetical protein